MAAGSRARGRARGGVGRHLAVPLVMVLVFGGITWMDLAALLLCYMAVALVAGSMGICFSAVFKQIGRAHV